MIFLSVIQKANCRAIGTIDRFQILSNAKKLGYKISNDHKYSTREVYNISDNYPSKTKVLPERDLVNFPRLDQNLYPPKVRFGVIPSSWFDFFYTKTGVTGSYLFLWGLVTTLLQKEIWVVETEFMTGFTFFLLQYVIIKKYGFQIKEYLYNKVKGREDELKQLHQSQINYYQEAIDTELTIQKEIEAPKLIAQFKRDNVDLQIEANYRERLLMLHNAVKKRLDYNLEVIRSKKDFEHQNMIDWVLRQVYQSITPQLEKEALNKCILDLKTLARIAPDH